MKNLDRLESPLLERHKKASLYTDVAFEKRAQCEAQKRVNRSCLAEARVIQKIAGEGALAEKIALECRLQKRDLEKYAQSPAEAKGVQQGLKDMTAALGVQQGLKDMTAALVSYTCLTDRPEEYRKQAAGYTDRNKDTKLGVPKDGMRYTLSSQITRLQNRLSLQLSEEERVLLTARRVLLDSLLQEYSTLQQTVMEENYSVLNNH